MRNRKGFDWSKPFKLVASKKEFDQLDTNEETVIVIQPEDEPVAPHHKEEIPVPKIQSVKPVANPKIFAKITPNYIRLPAQLNLPCAQKYELSEVDHAFVKSHEERFDSTGKKLLTAEFLKRAITQLQLKAGKDMSLRRDKGWMRTFLERYCKEVLQIDSAEELAEMIYSYWKNRREELKFPLLRLLWKSSPHEYNHMLAFRPRERGKRSLRRTNRSLEGQIIQQVYQEFELASQLVDRVLMREELKFKHMALQLAAFYADCRPYLPLPGYLQELKPEDRNKDRQRMKGFHAGLENYKNRKYDLQNLAVQEPGETQVDQKQPAVNFLPTAAHTAQLLGVNQQKLFSNTPAADRAVLPSKPTIETIETIEPIIEQLKGPYQYVNFSLQRFEDMLIRTFEMQSPVHHGKPCVDYLELKRRRVDGYYFGSDDLGEARDTRKNIAASFKRYLQMQHLTPTISATSEN